MYITMGDVEGQLLRELDEGHSQDSIALTYAFGIRDHHDRVDWKKINKAIVKRWSIHGLRHIKQYAWRLIQEQQNAP